MFLKKYFSFWLRSYRFRKQYCTLDHTPFFEIAGKFLPFDKDATILDLGSGDGQFVVQQNLQEKYENTYLLDGNENSVYNLKKKFNNVILWRTPDPLPFASASVRFIHCSHLIEHLVVKDLHELLLEVDRVLTKNGIFVVSSPMVWKHFYSDLTHVRPYNPNVLVKYLCKKSKTPSATVISENYSELERIYRYCNQDYAEGWGSSVLIIDFIIHFFKLVFSKFSLKKYEKNGYTIVLRKNE